jgi:coenzyme A diphosphatase NUDT7
MCSLFIPILEFDIQSYFSFSSSYPMSKLAAVLIILYEQDGLIRVVLTTRSKELRTHAGQTALPGGKKDSIDADSTATAVRSDKTNFDGYPLTL